MKKPSAIHANGPTAEETKMTTPQDISANGVGDAEPPRRPRVRIRDDADGNANSAEPRMPAPPSRFQTREECGQIIYNDQILVALRKAGMFGPRRLRGLVVVLLTVLLSFRLNKTQRCNPSSSTVGRILEIPRHKVSAITRKLEAVLHWCLTIERGKGPHGTNEYVFHPGALLPYLGSTNKGSPSEGSPQNDRKVLPKTERSCSPKKRKVLPELGTRTTKSNDKSNESNNGATDAPSFCLQEDEEGDFDEDDDFGEAAPRAAVDALRGIGVAQRSIDIAIENHGAMRISEVADYVKQHAKKKNNPAAYATRLLALKEFSPTNNGNGHHHLANNKAQRIARIAYQYEEMGYPPEAARKIAEESVREGIDLPDNDND